jgi:hypothetical protein
MYANAVKKKNYFLESFGREIAEVLGTPLWAIYIERK